LTQALGLIGQHDGADLATDPFRLFAPEAPVEVERTPRIGITKAAERPWRYVEAASAWASRARRVPAEQVSD
jgi:DNA-3-methyladenine glycosylase